MQQNFSQGLFALENNNLHFIGSFETQEALTNAQAKDGIYLLLPLIVISGAVEFPDAVNQDENNPTI